MMRAICEYVQFANMSETTYYISNGMLNPSHSLTVQFD